MVFSRFVFSLSVLYVYVLLSVVFNQTITLTIVDHFSGICTILFPKCLNCSEWTKVLNYLWMRCESRILRCQRLSFHPKMIDKPSVSCTSPKIFTWCQEKTLANMSWIHMILDVVWNTTVCATTNCLSSLNTWVQDSRFPSRKKKMELIRLSTNM